ncbi:MAG: anthranilate phosphoribosyltransferase [Victivallales bacterium]|nr:anthranilate phosphoribosyltransferase [Victivallales bacterium]
MSRNFDKILEKLFNNKDLETLEAKEAMLEIMSGNVPDIKLSAWLTALKMKGEAPSEISGCVSAMLEKAQKIELKNRSNAVDIVGTGGDGTHTINISTASAVVAAAAGLTVAKHGNRAVSSLSGSADVLSSLGVRIEIGHEKIVECLNEVGLSFLFAPLLHPAMKYAVPVRKMLGVRTIFNLLGPLCNPSGLKNAVIGVYSAELCRQIAEAAKQLNFNNVMVVHGRDGLDEITTTTSTKICELKNNVISEYDLYPEELGVQYSEIGDIKGGDADENAEIIRKIFNGKITGPKKDVILLNTAAALITGNKCENWYAAIKRADSVIKSGKAEEKLNHLIKFTNI